MFCGGVEASFIEGKSYCPEHHRLAHGLGTLSERAAVRAANWHIKLTEFTIEKANER
jgi:hypothetical protein